jgi:hypothetical protein
VAELKFPPRGDRKTLLRRHPPVGVEVTGNSEEVEVVAMTPMMHRWTVAGPGSPCRTQGR